MVKIANPPADSVIKMTYTNWKGEVAERAISPIRVFYGATEWHPSPGWLLKAWDYEKNAERDFALVDCHFHSNRKEIIKNHTIRQEVTNDLEALRELARQRALTGREILEFVDVVMKRLDNVDLAPTPAPEPAPTSDINAEYIAEPQPCELLPCPYCRVAPRRTRTVSNEWDGYALRVTINCPKCGLRTTRASPASKNGYADNCRVDLLAAESWNARSKAASNAPPPVEDPTPPPAFEPVPDNVVRFYPPNAADDPNTVLEWCKGHFKSVLVIGWNHDGMLTNSATTNLTDGGEMLWMIEKFKRNLLNGDYEADEPK